MSAGRLANLGLALSATAGLLLAAELALWLRDALAVPLHIVVDSPVVYALNPEHPDVSSQGLRDEEVAVPKPEGVFRVLVLGDSVAFGLGVSRGEAFPNLIEQRLRARSPGAEVLNAAVAGYSTYNELQYYLSAGAALQPDLVLVAFCMNDVANPRRHWNYTGRTPLRIPAEAIPNLAYDRAEIQPALRARETRRRRWRETRLYATLAPRVRRLQERLLPSDPRPSPPPHPTFITGEDPLSIEVLLDSESPEWKWLTGLFGRLRAAVEGDGAELGLVLMPLAYQLDEGYPHFPQHHLLEYCGEVGLTCFDLLPELKRAGRERVFRGRRPGRADDVWHLTRYGHEVVAAMLVDALGGEGLLPPDGRPKGAGRADDHP